MQKNRTFFIIYLFLSLVTLFSQTSYSQDWLVLDDEFQDRWQWNEIGGDLEGRLYRSSKIQNPTYKVLILCSKKSSSYIRAFNKLLEVAEERIPSIEFLFFNFNKDTLRASEIVEYGKNNNVNLIMAMGSEAMVFSSQVLKGDNIPIVTCINKDPVLLGFVDDYTSGSGSNIAYTSVNLPLNVNMEWLLKLRPNMRSITILYDPNHSSVVGSEVLPLMNYLKENDIRHFDGAVSADGDLQKDLSETIRKSLDFMSHEDPGLKNSLFWVTSSTNIFSEIETISANTGIVPVASSVPNLVNGAESSALLAVGIDRRNSANLAALYMVEILTGNSEPGDLPVGIVSPPDISISFQTAKTIGETIPFEIFENASFVYGYDGTLLREYGKTIKSND